MIYKKRFFTGRLLLFIFLFIHSCSAEKQGETLFRKIDPSQSGITFSNILKEDARLNILNYEYMYNGAGVAIGDINNDGLEDIFFTANMSSNRLYLNKGELSFEDISTASGIASDGEYWSTGVSMIDINCDGWLDIYVNVSGPYPAERRTNKLFINQKDLSFKESAKEYGLADKGHSIQTAFFDYDRDGDLDAYILTNTTGNPGPNVIRPKIEDGKNPNTDRLFRNDNGVFTNVSSEAGILKEGYGLGVSITDINKDGWPDIYVSNDYLSNDLLYINTGNGTFTDVASSVFDHTSYSAMGNDVVDLNGDGWQEIISVDMLPPDNLRRKLMFKGINYDRFRSEIISGYYPQYVRNTLQFHRGLNTGGLPVFSEIGQMAGIHSTDWSWSVLGADFDQDGKKDLLITNGYPRDITNLDFVAYKMNTLSRASTQMESDARLFDALDQIPGAHLSNYLFQNKGEFQFKDVSKEWGIEEASYSTGAAFGDLDNDGDLDIVINNTNSEAFLYENTLRESDGSGHFLQVVLEGSESNSMGIGAILEAFAGEQKFFYEHRLVRGFQSSVSPRIHFGLGKYNELDSLIIRWPDGKGQKMEALLTDSLYHFSYTESKLLVPTWVEVNPFFESYIPEGLQFKHEESHYADFKIQPLLPHKYSQSGPKLAVGDLDGNGLEDLVVGGAFKQYTQLFFQQSRGNFLSRNLQEGNKYEEDMGILMLDVENDEDLDLYVSSGGSEFKAGSRYYQDRLYINDGKGNFTRDSNALPKMPVSSSCVIASDIDQDGDMDMLVGGNIIPNDYPGSPGSFILINEGGKFERRTDEIAPGLKETGMVKDAIWADIDDDGWDDLLLTGEWMGLLVFRNEEGKLKKIENSEVKSGWWNSIASADLDNDGDIDFVLGNHGSNNPYGVSDNSPLSMYVKDFNGDGRKDPILTHYLEGKEYAYAFKEDLSQQMYDLRRWFPSYTDYASKAWAELFPGSGNEELLRYQIHSFESLVLENLGDFSFKSHDLPKVAQQAPVQDILLEDVDNDGWVDIILAQNSFAPETHSGRIDAGKGLWLKGKGKWEFEAVSLMKSGLSHKGDMRSLELMNWNGKQLIVFGINNGKLIAYVH